MSGQHTQPLRSLGIRLGRPPSGMQNEDNALILHPLRLHYCIPLKRESNNVSLRPLKVFE
jgi:hypothetical protein